tara:strand:+ start:734 stop:1321 length:588 start_codon:yes stop_codon:yes gene_type:complete
MSQLNVDQIKNRAGTGPALEMLSGGNFAIDTDTFYIDTSNNRVGINTASPQYSLHVEGGDGAYFAAHPMIEKVDVIGNSSNGNTTIYAGNGSVHRYTNNNTGNWTPNFLWTTSDSSFNNNTNTDDILVQTIISPNQSNSGYFTSINIDNSGRSVEWQDGEQPDDGNDNGYDVYQLTIVKTSSNSYIVFGNRTYCN